MNSVLRGLLRVFESLTYGPIYGTLQALIRTPEPLDAERTWNDLTGELPAAYDWVAKRYPPQFMRPLLIAAKMRQDHVLGIADHYDVSNEFYELWLDKKYMFYTCADFESGDESLEEAQSRKADRILELLQPNADDKILDLGPGWGPMLKRIYEETGDKRNLYGYTISQEQIAYNRAHDRFQVEFRNFITTEYEPSFFDKLYSIETLEHARPWEMPQLAAKLYQTLKPGGIAVHQFSARLAEPIPTAAPAVQLYFPGSVASSYGHMFRTFESAGFRILSQTVLDYRPTLRTWFERMTANRERALELVGVRTYNRYLTFFAVTWRWLNLGLGITVRMAMEKREVGKPRPADRQELVVA